MNLREARQATGLTQKQGAAHIGINQNTYSYWETGRSRVDTEALPKLAELFGVTVDYLLGKEPEAEPAHGVKIPVLGRVAAGIPIEAVEEVLDYEEISPEMARQGEFFALQIKGRSMEPRMQEGDIIICKPAVCRNPQCAFEKVWCPNCCPNVKLGKSRLFAFFRSFGFDTYHNL